MPAKKPVKQSYQPTRSMRRRLGVVSLLTLAGSGVLFINLFNTSVTQHDKYAAMANDSQFKSTTVEANRGSIYDSNGKILAQSATVYNVIVNPSAITGLNEEKYPAEKKDKMEVVVSFLAILELMKMGRITAVQEQPFGDLDIAEVERPEGSDDELDMKGLEDFD